MSAMPSVVSSVSENVMEILDIMKEGTDYSSVMEQDSPSAAVVCCKASATPYSDATRTKKHSPNHVKRPMNAFMVWSQKQRRILNPEASLHHAELSKSLGKRWKAMSNDEQKPHFEESARLRLLHHQEYPDYKYKPKKKKSADALSPKLLGISGGSGKISKRGVNKRCKRTTKTSPVSSVSIPNSQNNSPTSKFNYLPESPESYSSIEETTESFPTAADKVDNFSITGKASPSSMSVQDSGPITPGNTAPSTVAYHCATSAAEEAHLGFSRQLELALYGNDDYSCRLPKCPSIIERQSSGPCQSPKFSHELQLNHNSILSRPASCRSPNFSDLIQMDNNNTVPSVKDEHSKYVGGFCYSRINPSVFQTPPTSPPPPTVSQALSNILNCLTNSKTVSVESSVVPRQTNSNIGFVPAKEIKVEEENYCMENCENFLCIQTKGSCQLSFGMPSSSDLNTIGKIDYNVYIKEEVPHADTTSKFCNIGYAPPLRPVETIPISVPTTATHYNIPHHQQIVQSTTSYLTTVSSTDPSPKSYLELYYPIEDRTDIAGVFSDILVDPTNELFPELFDNCSIVSKTCDPVMTSIAL